MSKLWLFNHFIQMQYGEDSDVTVGKKASIQTSRNDMTEKFRTSSASFRSNKVEPKHSIDEHGGIKTWLPHIGGTSFDTEAHAHREPYSSRHLPPLSPSSEDVVKSINETSYTHQRTKKKKKKRKSRRKSREEENIVHHAGSESVQEKSTRHSQHRVS